MKSYTDLEQSKKLAKILPITSIDFAWNIFSDGSTRILRMDDWEVSENAKSNVEIIPCWSLAALLDVLPIRLEMLRDGKWNAMISRDGEARSTVNDNPINACYELIIKLKEMDLL